MEKERPFKLFLPPRISHGQVFAVKPQEMTEDGGLNQAFGKRFDSNDSSLPLTKTNTSKYSKPANPDPVLKKMPIMPEVVCTEKVSQLYSKLYEEAENIKRWKVATDAEVVQKDKKLQENKRTIETQRKAIQELQFGNESLSMKLEEEMNENKNVNNKNLATRHLCNLLKETFERSGEKMNLYESEREETHHLLIQNNKDIQRMVLAFDGLQIQAENERKEMKIKLKESKQQSEELRRECHTELRKKQEQVLQLKQKYDEKDNELQQIWLHFQETKQKYEKLEEAARKQYNELQDSHRKQEVLLDKQEKAENSHKKTQEQQKVLETILETKERTLGQVIMEKDAAVEELNKTKECQAAAIKKLQDTIQSLETSLTMEKLRSEELDKNLNNMSVEANKITCELGAIEEHKKEKEKEIKQLTDELGIARQSITVLEEKFKNEEKKARNLITELEVKNTALCELKEAVELLSDVKGNLEKDVEQLQKDQEGLKHVVQKKEFEICEIQEQLSAALGKERVSLEEVDNLKMILAQKEKSYEELTSSFSKLLLDQEQLSHEKKNVVVEVKNLEKQQKASKQNEEKARKEIEKLEEENNKLREEIESLKENIEQNGLDTENKLEEHEENNKSLHNELAKKDRQLKTVETKLNNLKKQMENKSKSHEELQQEIKNLKRKIATESKECSQFEAEVNELKMEHENVKRQHDEEIKNLKKDFEAKAVSEAELYEEVQKLKLTADEAVKKQKETEIKCQHKTAEMVALMEKHKKQYDRMVEEKDAELEQQRKKEMEKIANKTSLEQELSRINNELSHFKQQLQTVTKEKEKIEKEAKVLKENIESLKEKLKKRDIMEQEVKILQENLESKEEKTKKKVRFMFTEVLTKYIEY
ncbi:synaptonemal complex protein 1 [Acipenser oxyrinchus oxyrinchus]|uniref:Synaptonemal complex protein 1 n=1 Tax=Acipenser oxyrinchus oxyrinchus TaxID=40147 RepID=A0AAD8CKJ1_ACIOX|nr:synaptonemal complex protein 1 [Acipenser oxyrinchus oxyrinchus]